MRSHGATVADERLSRARAMLHDGEQIVRQVGEIGNGLMRFDLQNALPSSGLKKSIRRAQAQGGPQLPRVLHDAFRRC